MGMIWDLIRTRSFSRGADVYGVAQAFDELEHYGPAAFLYQVAHEKLRFGGGVPGQLRDIHKRMNECYELAASRGENVNFAVQVGSTDICRHPDPFIKWYYEQQAGRLSPWHAPTAEDELREKKRAERHRKARLQEELEAGGNAKFQKRFNAMLSAAAKAADGDELAFQTAVSLYRRPSDREDFGEPWSEFARAALKKTLDQSADKPEVAKALAELPRIARKGEDMEVKSYIIGAVAGSLIWPVTYNMSRFIAWLLPDSMEGGNIILALFCSLVALVGVILYVIAWVAKWLTLPWVIGWIIAILTYFLPRDRKAVRAIETRDIRLMNIDKLFTHGDGTPIDKLGT